MPGLQVGVIAGPDGAHAGRLVARVGLGRVLEVRVRSARAVDADVPRHTDVRTAVRFTHYCHHGDLATRTTSVTSAWSEDECNEWMNERNEGM